MTRILLDRCRRFLRKDDGSATVEFMFVFPIFLSILFWTVELGLIHVRQTFLERAVDETVRDIRLGTGEAPQHDDIRDLICARSVFTENCSASLHLEMVQLDPYDWAGISQDLDCVESVEVVQPVRSFENGQSNELMFLRACLKFDPIFPNYYGLVSKFSADDDGRISIYAASAFVQEPR